MILLLGSRAARAWFDDFRFRVSTDWDAIIGLDDLKVWASRNHHMIRNLIPASDHKYMCRMTDGTRIEFEILDPNGSSGLLLNMISKFRVVPFPGDEAYAVSPELLWLTKRAHAIWPIHWQKTMFDMHWLRRRAPSTDADAWAYHDLRRAEHTGRFGQRKINLNMSNDAFFAKSAKAVQRVIDHDELHEIVKYGDRPLYQVFKRDLKKASLDRKLFEQSSHEDQTRLVREEAMVIALERYIIPQKEISELRAYATAVQRICTTLTAGWFRDFAIDNWPEIRILDRDYVALWHAAASKNFKEVA